MEIKELLEQKQEEMVKSLQGCVRIPSVHAQDGSGYPYGRAVQECLEYVLKLAEQMGFSTCNLDNYIGWCEYGSGEELVVVLGHLDVVPEGDGWTYPPYEGRIVDDRIYGRGTMDDKGPVIAALYGLWALKESGVPIKRRIRLIFGLCEETGNTDTRYYKDHGGETPVMGFTPDGEYPVINGEKGQVNEQYACDYEQRGHFRLKEIRGGMADNMVPELAWAEFVCPKELAEQIVAEYVALSVESDGLRTAEGIVCLQTADGIRVEAKGVSAHGAVPQEGINAIGRLLQYLNVLPLEGQLATAVQFLAEKIGLEYDGASLGIAMSDEVSGPLTLNMGVIYGDEKSLAVKLNCRYPVTKHPKDCGLQIKKMFEAAGFCRTFSKYGESLYMPEKCELVQRLMKVYSDYTKETAAPKSIGGGTYAKALPNVLAFGPVFPGDEAREHKPDEYMEIHRLMDNANIYAQAMYALAAE